MDVRVILAPTAVAKLRLAPLRADGLHETRVVDRDMGEAARRSHLARPRAAMAALPCWDRPEPPNGLNLGVVIGPDFRAMNGNLARNIGENRLACWRWS